jgi:hypothetical protein
VACEFDDDVKASMTGIAAIEAAECRHQSPARYNFRTSCRSDRITYKTRFRTQCICQNG